MSESHAAAARPDTSDGPDRRPWDSMGGKTWFCPRDATLAAYADGRLPERIRPRVERHISRCSFCLSQVALLTRLSTAPLQDVPGHLLLKAREIPGTAPLLVPRLAWAAATLMVLVSMAVVVRLAIRGPDPVPVEPIERIRSAESSPSVAILQPPEGGVLPGTAGNVRWTAVERALFYEVRITDERGALVWQGRTESVELSVPRLDMSGHGFVWVTAQLPDNRSVRSRAIGFSVRNP